MLESNLLALTEQLWRNGIAWMLGLKVWANLRVV